MERRRGGEGERRKGVVRERKVNTCLVCKAKLCLGWLVQRTHAKNNPYGLLVFLVPTTATNPTGLPSGLLRTTLCMILIYTTST